MAVEYPVNFSDEKRTFVNPDYSKGVLSSIKEVFSDLQSLAEGHNTLDEKTQESINDLKKQLDALSALDKIEVEKLTSYVEKLKNIIDTVDSSLDIIGTLDALADEINARESIIRKEVVFTSSSGKVLVDISDLGLKSKDDYTILVSTNGTLTDGTLNPAVLRTTKVNEKTFEIVAQDSRQFFELNPLYTDGGTQDNDGNYPKSFIFSLGVVYSRPVISRTIASINDTTATAGK
jgi:hypothetical protein